MSYGPRKVVISDIAVNTLGASISGFVGSIIILLVVFMTSSFLSIPGTFEQARLVGGNTNPMFPFILSFVTFIATTVSLVLSAKILHMTDPEKYKSNNVIYGQLGFFGILIYLCITPVYIYMGLQNYDNIMIIFVIHTLMLMFGSSLLLEILNNYRYVLTGFYGSFIALLGSAIITLSLFYSFESGQAKLISLLIVIPLVSTLMVFFKGIFELLYFYYHRLTNLDGLGDIFYAIENEEKELLREEEQKNNM